MVDDGAWFIPNQERPLVPDLHGAVVGDVYIAGHLCVIQDTSKVHHRLLKVQIGEVHLSTESYVVLVNELHIRTHLVMMLAVDKSFK